MPGKPLTEYHELIVHCKAAMLFTGISVFNNIWQRGVESVCIWVSIRTLDWRSSAIHKLSKRSLEELVQTIGLAIGGNTWHPKARRQKDYSSIKMNCNRATLREYQTARDIYWCWKAETARKATALIRNERFWHWVLPWKLRGLSGESIWETED